MRAEVAAGFAAGDDGTGVAYAALGSGEGRALLRIPFRVQRSPALAGREIGYAALTALCAALRSRGVRRVRFRLEDAGFAGDVREHRDVPPPLTMAYVRLGCALNQFAEFEIASSSGERRLTAMALSDVSVHAAA